MKMTEAELAAYKSRAQGWMPGQGEPRPRPAYADMHETDVFMPAVIELAKTCGWRVYHTHDSRRSEEGFPDLVMVRVREGIARLVFAELKSEKGATTPEQQAWLYELRSVPGLRQVYLWRPEHWHDGTIEGVLR